MFKKISMALISGAIIAISIIAKPAIAEDFNFEFVTDSGAFGPPSGAGSVIKGTIFGLTEGINSVDSLTAEVTSAPFGNGVGGGYIGKSFGSSNAEFVVSGGKITSYFGDFVNSFDNYLGFDSAPEFGGSKGGFQLLESRANACDHDMGKPGAFCYEGYVYATFTPVIPATSVPEPGENVALGGVALLMAGGVAVRSAKSQIKA